MSNLSNLATEVSEVDLEEVGQVLAGYTETLDPVDKKVLLNFTNLK